ncbi:hypothetical protein ACE1EF_08190 [Saccharicrinis sp. FJH54]
MKKIFINIMAVLFLGVLFTGCENWEQYDSISVTPAPSLSLNLVSVMDSSVSVTMQSSAAGYLTFLITADTAMTTPDGTDLLVGNSSGLEEINVKVAASQTVEYTFMSGLEQNTPYLVYAVSSNADGVVSDVKRLEVLTDDNYKPVLVSVSPSRSSTASQENSFSVDLTFSEPVQLVDASKFSFTYYYDDTVVTVMPEDISVDGDVVTVSQSRTPYDGEYVFLSWEAGAVSDFLAGSPNMVDARVSGVIDGELAGLYWRVQHVPFDMGNGGFIPETGTAVTDNGFDIMYVFPFEVSLSEDYEAGMVNVTFWREGKSVNLEIPADYLAVDGDTLFISLTEAAEYGDWVSVNMEEGVVQDMYGNPNAAFESGSDFGGHWLVSYGRDINVLAGSYKVSGTEYFSDAAEEYDVKIEIDLVNAGQVLITGLFGSTDTIVGTFNSDFSTLTVMDEESLGEVNGAGSDVVFANPFGDGMSVGFVDASGNTSMPIGAYDYAAGGWFKAMLSSTWTKQ